MTFPEFTEEVLAIDIETREYQELTTYGPGAHRHYIDGEDSYILGVSISDSTRDFYWEASKELFDWLRSIVSEHIWVGHNVLYDLAWLWYEGFKPQLVCDTVGLVKLLAEDRQPRKGYPKPYSLDACGHDYLGIGKKKDEIAQWCKERKLTGDSRKWLWKMVKEGFGDIVAEYAKMDTRVTYALYQKLIPEIGRQGLQTIWDIETALLPILAENNHKGIRVDNSRRLEASEALGREVKLLEHWLWDKAGQKFNPRSGKQLKTVFDKLGLEYKINPPTEKMLEKDPLAKGNPSFKGEYLLPYGIDPDMEYFPHVLITHNKLRKLKHDFVDRLEDFIVQGRIHSTINPMGAKTGRPTSKTPNIFQIPKRGRGKEICRVLFLPEEGEEWASMDYASEEYRVFAHYAVGQGSDEYRYKYNTEDKYDMHIENGRLAGVNRTKAKTIGLGVLFGMGAKKMAANLGEGEKKGLEIVQRFHETNPSFKATSKLVESRAKSRGYIHTKLGRRRRFPHGEGAYRGLNFLTQGNSADLAKLTIVEANKRGLLDKVNFLLWLYDEYNLSALPENRKYVEEFKELGETVLKFRVKMNLDMTTGENWGRC